MSCVADEDVEFSVFANGPIDRVAAGSRLGHVRLDAQARAAFAFDGPPCLGCIGSL
jgi:hypothetical protein